MALVAGITAAAAIAGSIASATSSGVSSARAADAQRYSSELDAAVKREGLLNDVKLQQLQAQSSMNIEQYKGGLSQSLLSQRIAAQQTYLQSAYSLQNDAWKQQFQATTGAALNSARQYGIPDYMTLRGQVPMVSRQVAGNNFFTAPPGVSNANQPIFNE